MKKLPMMNRGSICWVRVHVLGMTFDKAHRWQTVWGSRAYPVTTFDSVVCTVCGEPGWRTRDSDG
jgi:hypothetical protein